MFLSLLLLSCFFEAKSIVLQATTMYDQHCFCPCANALQLYIKLHFLFLCGMLKRFPCCHPYRNHRGHLRCRRDGRVQQEHWGSFVCCFTSQSGEGVLQETGVDQAGFGSPYTEGGAGLSVPLQRASRTHIPQSKLLSVPGAPERTDCQRWYYCTPH